MTIHTLKPKPSGQLLLFLSMAVSAFAENANPTFPPTGSDEPKASYARFGSPTVVLVIVVLVLCMIITRRCCKTRILRRLRIWCCRKASHGTQRYETLNITDDYSRPPGYQASVTYNSINEGEDNRLRIGSTISGLTILESSILESSSNDLDIRIGSTIGSTILESSSNDLDIWIGSTIGSTILESSVSRKRSLDDEPLHWRKRRMSVSLPTFYEDISEEKAFSPSRRLELDEGVDISLFLYKEQYFDRNGGVLVVPEAEVSLSIPPGAIAEGCIISVNVVPTRSVTLPGQGLVPRLTPLVICEPDGLQFQKAVELILPHCGIIDDPVSHTVNVNVGRKSQEKYFSRDMKWTKEDVEYKLTRRFCHIFLKHFSGVNVNVSDTKEKMLRAIPFASAIDDQESNEDIIVNMWLCNDLAADYLTLVKNEIKNKNIPLDSYDTFRLNTSDDQQKTYIEVTTEGMDGSNWLPEITTKNLDIHGLTTTTKSKCTFRYVNQGDNKDYFYASIIIEQKTGEDERESLFVLRKRKSDLTRNSECLKAEDAFLAANCCLSASGRPPPEHPPKSCIAVPFVDSMIYHGDDILLTLWLLSEESAEQMLSNFEDEQGLLQKIKFDTENTFTIRDAKKPVTSTIFFRKGNWKPNSDKMEVDIEKVLRGTRAKFPFVGRKETNDNSGSIDVEMTIAQEGEENRTEFIKRKRVEEFLFESIKPLEVDFQQTDPPDPSRKFDTLCQAMIGSLSEDDCQRVATYFEFRPAHIEEVVSSHRPAQTLIRMLQQRLLFTERVLGWFQNALIIIHRNDLAETVGRFKMQNQGVEFEKPL